MRRHTAPKLRLEVSVSPSGSPSVGSSCAAPSSCAARDNHVYIRAWLVLALAVAGSGGEAMDSADGLIEAAEATGNPLFLALALTAYGVELFVTQIPSGRLTPTAGVW